MSTLADSINSFLENKKNPTSERAHLIQVVCDTLFDDKDFKKILGQTKQLTVEEIRTMFEQAKNWQQNPQALFWKLLREKQKEIKSVLDTENPTHSPLSDTQ